MKAKNSLRIKPFENYNSRLVLSVLTDVAPSIACLDAPRKGIRQTVNKLRKTTVGILSRDDVEAIYPGLVMLYAEAHYALLSTLIMLGDTLSPLLDMFEYEAFSDIVLPERGGSPPKNIIWSRHVAKATAHHFENMGLLRKAAKQAPKYRKRGHDYCQDMLEMCIRMIMRPAVVKFSRFIEKQLGWPSVKHSGILSLVHVNPKLPKSRGGIQ